MKVLTIKGGAKSGKSTALRTMYDALGGYYVEVPRGSVVQARADIADCGESRLYIDFEGYPSRAFLDYATATAKANGVEYLTIASA